MAYIIFFLSLLSIGSYGQGQDFNVTKTIPSGDDPVVAAVAGAENVVIVCEIVDSVSGELERVTRWEFTDPQQQATILEFDSSGIAGDMNSQNFMSSPNSDFRRNLTILNFSSEYDGAEIGCGRGQTIGVTFTLRLIVLPSLIVDSQQVVAESSTFSFSLESSSGFPLIPDTFQWSIGSDIIPIDSVNPNISVYPNITFTSVHRNDSGNYSISVTNGAGTTNGSFILDVQYGPEGVANAEGTRYVLVGTNVTIIGFSSVNGNPSPSSSWSLDGSAVVSGGRLSTDINGQLSILSVQLNDTGFYTNTLRNTVTGQDMSIDNTIELLVSDGPSMPRNVTVLNVGPDYVNISWVNPLDIGTPLPLHQYTVTAVSSVNTVSMNVTDVNTNDPDYVNTLVVYGLKPNTMYTVTIQGTSTVAELGDLMGDSSEPVSFNTTLGAPRFSSSVLVSSNGNLSVSWQFLHTGGGSISSITVQCFSTVDDELLPASAAPLATMIDCTGSVQCDTSTDIGPVTTGMNYSCIVTAENSVGFEDEMRTNYVIANTGLPSEAVLISVVGGAGSARIILRVDHYGVTDASQFFFNITVYSNGSMVDQRTVSPDDINNPVNTLNIDGLPVGMISFTISTSNIYGTPLTMNNATTSVVTVIPITSTTTQSTPLYTGPSTTTASTISTGSISGSDTVMPTSTPTDTITTITPGKSTGLSGGAIAGIVIAVIILLAIVALVVFIVVYLVYQSKGDSYKVEGGKGVVVEEHDIDIGTELQSTKPIPDGSSPEKAPLANNPPRQELHYADLADFAPSKKPGQQATPTATSTAKPMPIEEVQYAVIRPQDQKKPDDAGATADDNL